MVRFKTMLTPFRHSVWEIADAAKHEERETNHKAFSFLAQISLDGGAEFYAPLNPLWFKHQPRKEL
jgi:hypothetical protein